MRNSCSKHINNNQNTGPNVEGKQPNSGGLLDQQQHKDTSASQEGKQTNHTQTNNSHTNKQTNHTQTNKQITHKQTNKLSPSDRVGHVRLFLDLERLYGGVGLRGQHVDHRVRVTV